MRSVFLLCCFSTLTFISSELAASPTIQPGSHFCVYLSTNAGRQQKSRIEFLGDKADLFEDILNKKEKKAFSIDTTSTTAMSLSVSGFYSKNGWKASRVKTRFKPGSYTYTKERWC